MDDARIGRGATIGEHRARLAADTRAIEPLGDHVLVYFSVDAPAVGVAALASTAGESEYELAGGLHNGVTRLSPASTVRPGERVAFGVEWKRLHYFDPDTGQAIRVAGLAF
ncbi:MAG TPA: hypothetical protein VMR14_05290 [Streptosporangiaceae bacterium]|nr:hypothetical protein [Streptosporangiaceae bacterium]